MTTERLRYLRDQRARIEARIREEGAKYDRLMDELGTALASLNECIEVAERKEAA